MIRENSRFSTEWGVYSFISRSQVRLGQKGLVLSALTLLYYLTDHTAMFSVDCTMNFKTCRSPDKLILYRSLRIHGIADHQ